MSSQSNDSISTQFLNQQEQMVCIQYAKSMFYSRSIYHGKNIPNSIMSVFMLQLIMAFLVSRTVYIVLRPLRQHKFVSNVLGGIILGPSVLGRNEAFMDRFFPLKEKLVFNTMATIGALSTVFIIAVKIDTTMMFRRARSTWVIVIPSLFIPYILTLALSYKLLDYLPGSIEVSFLFLVASTLTNPQFPVIAHAMDEMNLSNSELGQLAISCSVLTAIIELLLTAVSVIIQQKSTSETYKSAGSFIALLFFIVCIVRPMILRIINITPEGKPVKRIYVLTILLGALVMAVISDLVTGSGVPGVLLMGLIIPDGPPLGAILLEKSELMITEFFLPLFFVRIGYEMDLFSIKDWMAFTIMQLIILAGYLGTIFGTCLASFFFRITLRNAFLLSNILNIRGLIELMHFMNWRTNKFIDEPSYSSLVLSNLALTSIVTFITHIFYKPHTRLKVSASVKEHMRSLQTTPINAELRILSCIHNEDNVHGIINLLEAFNPTDTSPVCAYVIHIVELVGQAAPLLVPYKNHTRRFKPSSTDHIMRAFTNYSKSSHGPVTIFPFKMIAPFKTMHESICTLAEDKFTPLIIVPFHKNQEHHNTNPHLRIFNTNIQSYAPCTVGILVDIGLPCKLRLKHFSYSVAVLFLGGADDREALAFASLMSRHPNVSITVLRVNLRGKHKEGNDFERLFDDLLVREFKAMNTSNTCVVCHEVVAEDTEEVIDAVRSLGNNYDLIILGKRRGPKGKLEEELVQWTQYPELGVIGDVIVSPDFFGAMMISMLVIQHCGDVNVDTDLISVLDNKTDHSHIIST